MRDLILKNVEYLITMDKQPPLTEEHRARILKNLEEFEPINDTEEVRKKICISEIKVM